MPEPLTIAGIFGIIKIASGILSAIGVLFGMFKIINWIKVKLSNIDTNVVELKNSMDSHITGLRDDIKSQTINIVSELKEQRSDFRTFYGPTLLHMQLNSPLAAPLKAKRTVRKAVKKKASKA